MNFDTTLVVCAAIILFVSVIGISAFHINDRILMSKNVDAAISKGIDPLAVRCAYARENDVVCVAFAASDGNFVLQSKK
jgi:hypothetical protein